VAHQAAPVHAGRARPLRSRVGYCVEIASRHTRSD
jgi:hypothetical protein